jgi:CheY-like chemotaxis protein
MMRDWNVLVVDDDRDVHTATQIALKYSRWRGRAFKLQNAYSAKEAEKLLERPEGQDIDVAIIDVVMETNDAGLELCRAIRAKLPRTLRIILRTGQAGHAPEERVLSDFDIDYYLAKADVTQQRLFATVRACLRSSQDIATIMALEAQLRGCVEVLQRAGTLAELMSVMATALKFLETKHGVRLILIKDVTDAPGAGYRHPLLSDARGEAFDRARAAIVKAHQQNVETARLQSGGAFGLKANEWIFPTIVQQDPEAALAKRSALSKLTSWFKGGVQTAWEPIRGGLFVQFSEDARPGAAQELEYDVGLFFKNWNLAFTTLQLQENVARQRALSAEAFWYLDSAKTKARPTGGTT